MTFSRVHVNFHILSRTTHTQAVRIVRIFPRDLRPVFIMKTENAFVWALTIFFHVTYSQGHFNISRKRPQGDDGWTNGVDHFTIPRILCPQDPNRTCTSFNGLSVGPTRCICQCPSTKTTFAFTESQWHCMDQENNDMRAKMQSVQYSKPVEKGKLKYNL